VPGTDRRVRWLHEIYTIADPACTSRVTCRRCGMPKSGASLITKSSEIIRMFNTAFARIAESTPDYYPEALRPTSTRRMRLCSRA